MRKIPLTMLLILSLSLGLVYYIMKFLFTFRWEYYSWGMLNLFFYGSFK